MNWLQRWALKQGVNRMGAWLQKVIKGDLGWKTILSAVALVALVISRGAGWITPDQFDQHVKLAEALGFIGLRDALSKLPH